MPCSHYGDINNYCVIRAFSARPCAKLLAHIYLIYYYNLVRYMFLT